MLFLVTSSQAGKGRMLFFEDMGLTMSQSTLDTPWKQGAIRIRRTLNQFLDSNTPVVFRAHQFNRRALHDLFIWGGLAQANKTKEGSN